MPAFPIVDAHVHLYDVDRLFYPWLAEVPAIAGSHLPADFDRATEPVAVDRIVFAEVDVADGQAVAEAGFVAGLARADRRIQGAIACARVERGAAVEGELDALAASGPLTGIRRLIQGRPAGFCTAPAFVEGVRRVGRRGLPFDICVHHPQLGEALELVRRCPDVAFVLDHIGKPGIAAGLVEPWRAEIRAAAALPNLVCKVSGVITEAGHRVWTPDQIAPYIEHVIACFGFDRVLFGGDWPVVTLAGGYADWVAALDRIVAGASADEQRRLYRTTAIRTYGLPPD